MGFKSIDHIGIAVTDLEVSVPWWSYIFGGAEN